MSAFASLYGDRAPTSLVRKRIWLMEDCLLTDAQQCDNRHRDRSDDEEDVDEEGYETPDPRMDELQGMANE